MTKRVLIISLLIVFAFSMVGCGADKNESVVSDTVISQIAQDENSNIQSEITSSEAEEEAESSDSPVSSKEPHSANQENNKDISSKTSSSVQSQNKKPAPQSSTSSKNTVTSSQSSKPVSSQSTQQDKTPKVKEIKLIDRIIAEPYILKDGTDLVARLYNTKTIQTGDKLIFSVTLENAKLSDCVIKTPGGTYEVVGNQIEVTANGKRDGLGLIIELPGYNSNTPHLKAGSETYSVIRCSGNLIDIVELEIKAYAERKGIRYCNGTDVWGYIWNPITKERDVNLSITKNISRGCDTIMIEGNKYWVDDCINLIDKYKEIGIVQMFMEKQQKFVTFTADTAESIKYWENQ